ncbi:hypothetical protein HPB51_005288 [Rhipicephalus microplus]|uniref:Uncharacterized protein n=1 Tax=Rhipicephalus microplus TaxID=6941 RepID=A0A9J6EYQ5_RHIMP|nr:hypothetical protein HPB51_005288 [Rhipicephalus microplus]
MVNTAAIFEDRVNVGESDGVGLHRRRGEEQLLWQPPRQRRAARAVRVRRCGKNLIEEGLFKWRRKGGLYGQLGHHLCCLCRSHIS